MVNACFMKNFTSRQSRRIRSLDKAAAVSAAANVMPGALSALDEEWRPSSYCFQS